jgi:MFS family permease
MSALLVAIPIGYFADLIGRPRAMALVILGILAGTGWILLVCMHWQMAGEHLPPTARSLTVYTGAHPDIFPVKYIWLASIFYLCGGGYGTALVSAWALASDVVTTVNRCPKPAWSSAYNLLTVQCRSQFLFYLFSVDLTAELVAPAIASRTMDASLKIPFAIAVASLLLCFPILAFLSHALEASGHGHGTCGTIHIMHASQQEGRASGTGPIPSQGPMGDTFKATSQVDSLKSFLGDKNCMLVLAIFFILPLKTATLSVLLQYVSYRFDWLLSTVSLLPNAPRHQRFTTNAISPDQSLTVDSGRSLHAYDYLHHALARCQITDVIWHSVTKD